MPVLYELRAPHLVRYYQNRPEPGSTNVGFPLFDAMFAALRKRNDRPTAPKYADDSTDLRRTPDFGKSEQEHAERGYSFVRMLPTACVTAGVLTLSLTIGSGEKFVVQAKPARMGGLIGFQGRFE
jgi:hypothetical protein